MRTTNKSMRKNLVHLPFLISNIKTCRFCREYGVIKTSLLSLLFVASMSREELVQFHDNRRKNRSNQSPATNANATPLQPRKEIPTPMITDSKN
uniref:Uncharacterized protein n=1 Tax=Caenorhabditis japonica TaxID=281687 RepID=A0A8R1EBX7_CAEJA